MKALCATLALAALVSASPCRADEPVAGAALVTSSHGQPFCTDVGQLKALVRAQIAHAPYGSGAFPGCSYVTDNAIVTVVEDLSPRARYMHIVRAHLDGVLFGPTDGYTFSAGLYSDAIRPHGLFSFR